MKLFRIIIAWFLAIIAVLAAGSYLLPKTYLIERSIIISADKALVYKYISHLQLWTEWIPWKTDSDTSLKHTFVGFDGENGTAYLWDSEMKGKGKLVLDKLETNKYVHYQLSINDGTFKSEGKITINSQGQEKTVVKWMDKNDLGYNPITRYTRLFFKQKLTPDLENSLKKLKKLCETASNNIKVSPIQP
ncbi:MAG TPA: SRPBCC family protein [Bacteroidales bacterium]|nr:SRPBCC family protein [Bacteroidales bacterium]